MTALHDLTALEQAALLRSGALSPLDLAEYYLDRSARLGDTVGAFVRLTPDLARAQASAAEAALRAGTGGPLTGIPCPVKDLTAVAGVPIRYGSAALDLVPEADDDVVAAIRAAGLVITGKTNTPELGLPCYTEPDVAPPARTPWDLDRSASGSSGGAAAAVAAGLAPLAHGNDGGGSVRTPAAVCGLVGLKPGRGRVSNGPGGELPGELVVQGCLTRSVADAAAMLDVLATPRPGDAAPLPDPGPGGFLAALATPPPRLRVGVLTEPLLADVALAGEVVTAIDETAGVLDGLGHALAPTPLPMPREAVASFEVLWSVLALSAAIPADAEPMLRPLTRWLRDRGRATTGLALAEALVAIGGHARAARRALAAHDVVLCPTLARLPMPVGGLRDDTDPAGDFEQQKRFSPFTVLANVTGLPAVNVPVCWTAAGLPVGVQLIGRPGGEALILQVAAQLERARPWAHRHPAIWTA